VTEVSTDWDCLFRRVRPLVGFETIHNNAWLSFKNYIRFKHVNGKKMEYMIVMLKYQVL
jgi:hypothetical protein